jgi:hypothetical protein
MAGVVLDRVMVIITDGDRGRNDNALDRDGAALRVGAKSPERRAFTRSRLTVGWATALAARAQTTSAARATRARLGITPAIA